ncbi:hypothetical protein [Cysteiniphilum sp. 6C5]|uniref:hypothetical protein n=1 Tax=unclassified Cysteiniphilum TaxID=2610889 RepID=UPI003F848E84
MLNKFIKYTAAILLAASSFSSSFAASAHMPAASGSAVKAIPLAVSASNKMTLSQNYFANQPTLFCK